MIYSHTNLKAFSLIFSLILFSPIGCFKKSQDLSERPVIDVNGRKLKSGEFAERLAEELRGRDALAAKDPAVLSFVKDQVAQNFIVETVMDEWAKKNGIFVRAEDLEREVELVRKGYPDQLAFEAALAKEGLTYRTWRSRLETSVLQKLVFTKLAEEIGEPTSSEIESHYRNHKEDFQIGERLKLRQIVLNTEHDAKQVESELRKGQKKFQDLAREFSISPEASSGGELGWVEKGSFEIFDRAFQLKGTTRSPIWKSDFGYHIIEVLGRRPAQTRPLEEVRERIKRQLLAKREQAMFSGWLESQVQSARVYKDTKLIESIGVKTQ